MYLYKLTNDQLTHKVSYVVADSFSKAEEAYCIAFPSHNIEEIAFVTDEVIVNIKDACIVTPDEDKPFGYYCNKRSVQYEKCTTIVSLLFCNHKDNPEPYEGNCRKEICPIVKAIKDI